MNVKNGDTHEPTLTIGTAGLGWFERIAILLLLLGTGFACALILDLNGDTTAIQRAQATAAEATAAATRNGDVQGCGDVLDATYDGWVARFTQAAANDDLAGARSAADKAIRLVTYRIGVAEIAAEDVGSPFVCPALPEDVVINGVRLED